MSISKTSPAVIRVMKALKKLETGSCSQIESETGMNLGTLKHALVWMKRQNMIHVCQIIPGARGGSSSNIYAAGKAPEGLVVEQKHNTSPVKHGTVRFFKGTPIVPADEMLSIFLGIRS